LFKQFKSNQEKALEFTETRLMSH